MQGNWNLTSNSETRALAPKAKVYTSLPRTPCSALRGGGGGWAGWLVLTWLMTSRGWHPLRGGKQRSRCSQNLWSPNTTLRLFAATLIERGCLGVSPAYLVVVLVAVLHGWTIGYIVFSFKTSKQKKKFLLAFFFFFWFRIISEVALLTCSSGCLALTQCYEAVRFRVPGSEPGSFANAIWTGKEPRSGTGYPKSKPFCKS